MKKAAKSTTTGRTRATVFNMVSPSSRVDVGKVEQSKGEAKIIPWGEKNDLPHHYLRLIGASGTATSCLQILESFIIADGFAEDDAANLEVNEEQTADSLLQDMAGDIASLNGLALRIRFIDNKVMVENLALECVRKLDSGEFVYNPTFGQKRINKDLSETLPGYSNLAALKEWAQTETKETTEKGQLYYYYYKTKGAYDYPKPPYATTGGLADIENDAEISLYDLDELKSGFRLSAIVTALGDYGDTQDGEGNAIENPSLTDLKEQFKSFTERKDATEARKKVLLLTAESKEMIPSVAPFNNSKSLELLDNITNRIANKVCRHMNTAPPLIGIDSSNGWETQKLATQIQLFQMRILKYQSLIQRVMEELFPVTEKGNPYDWTISTLNPLQFVPDYLFQHLSAEQKETLISRYI